MLKRVGNYYHNFLKKHLSKNFFIENQDGFNMSLINLQDNKYLISIRFLGFFNVYKNPKIIVPGNYSGRKDKIYKALGEEVASLIDFGENFFWGSWTKDLNDNTILFVASINMKTLELIPDNSIKPFVISNYKIGINNFKYSDIRLFKNNDKIYCYDGFVSNIFEIMIDNKEIKIFMKYNNLHSYRNICKNIKTYDKNWAYWKTEKVNGVDNFVFLNWFNDDYVTVSYVPKKNPSTCVKKNLIKMKKDRILGLGSKKQGMFSFGSRLIETDKNVWLGVGHIKLIPGQAYENNNIVNFLSLVKENICKKSVMHTSYMYCVYYYVISVLNNKYKMCVSDGILYSDCVVEYNFSINFPIGVEIKNDNILVSLGMGDFYTYLIKEKKDNILKRCIHDIEYFDEEKYNFILEKNT
jgi:hypothetical protein